MVLIGEPQTNSKRAEGHIPREMKRKAGGIDNKDFGGKVQQLYWFKSDDEALSFVKTIKAKFIMDVSYIDINKGNLIQLK